MDNGYYLADRHRIDQVQLTGAVMRVLAEVWKRTIDPLRVEETFPVYLAAAVIVLGRGREASDVLARRYYMKAATEAGFSPVARDLALAAPVPGAPSSPAQLTLVRSLPADLVETAAIPATPMNLTAIERSLRFTGPVLVQQQIARGVSPEVAYQAGLAGTIAAGKRIMLDAGRSMLIDAAHHDKHVRGWARVSDGSPCSYCAMLVSRGPVYRSKSSASFRSHDRCGCGVRVVFMNEPDHGWSKNADALRRLWDGEDDPSRPTGSTLSLSEWRQIYEADRNAPAVPVTQPASPSRAA